MWWLSDVNELWALHLQLVIYGVVSSRTSSRRASCRKKWKPVLPQTLLARGCWEGWELKGAATPCNEPFATQAKSRGNSINSPHSNLSEGRSDFSAAFQEQIILSSFSEKVLGLGFFFFSLFVSKWSWSLFHYWRSGINFRFARSSPRNLLTWWHSSAEINSSKGKKKSK